MIKWLAGSSIRYSVQYFKPFSNSDIKFGFYSINLFPITKSYESENDAELFWTQCLERFS